MGKDSISPFTRRPVKGVFLLCKTSNPSAGELQSLRIASDGPSSASLRLFEQVATLAAGPWSAPHNNVGLVVGATDTEALAAVRKAAPNTWILAPGVGFQGGDLRTALFNGLRADGLGMLVPVSRGISRAADPAAAAKQLRDDMNAVREAFLASASSPAPSTAPVAATAAASGPVATATGGSGAASSGPSSSPSSAAAASASEALLPHQRAFIRAALQSHVLRFGSFTLKSGRTSPYFFNAGNFKTGASLAALGNTYAQAVASSVVDFDVLFGPAYKGIPLVAATAVCLSLTCGRDVPFAYNRKEAKDHGEGGTLVGADVAGKRVLIVDDVITAGTAIGEAVAIIQAAGGVPVGVVIGLDRQERGGGATGPMTDLSAVEQVRATYGIPVIAVATLANLIAYIQEAAGTGGAPIIGADGSVVDAGALLPAITEYRRQYGVGVEAGAGGAAGGEGAGGATGSS